MTERADAAPLIRRASPDDAEAFAALATRLFRATYRDSHEADDLDDYIGKHFAPERLRGQLAEAAGAVFFAEAQGVPIGYVQLREGPAHEAVVGTRPVELGRLYVDAAWFGSGIGRALLETAFTEAARRGADVIWLVVWRGNDRAKAFYRKQGFHFVGTQPFHIGRVRYDDDVMARPCEGGGGNEASSIMPPKLQPILAGILVRDLRAVGRELAAYPDEASLWRTPPGAPNSAGTLALHLAGNIQHYLGAMLGETGYRRDREAEFARRDVPRAELLAGIDAAIATVERTLAALPDERLGADFPQAVGGHLLPTGEYLVHLAGHLAYHLGQIDYHRRLVTGDASGIGAVAPGELAGARRAEATDGR